MRYEHVEKVILPALKKGKIVSIGDRFIDSITVYQGYGLGVDLELMRDLHELVKIKYPDSTFILDIDIQIGLSRSKHRNKYEEMNISLRFEKDFKK